jgi:hypothetical protein
MMKPHTRREFVAQAFKGFDMQRRRVQKGDGGAMRGE